MRNRPVILVISLLVVAGVAATVWAFLRPTYGDTVSSCEKALAARAEGDKAKPDACDGLKQDDYDALLVGQVLKDGGVVDEDGNVDLRRLADDPSTQP